jgi:hypothetical protein
MKIEMSMNEIVNALLAGGSKRTVLVEGPMGSGKTSMLHTVAEALPNHVPAYFDCTTKDIIDLFGPDINRDKGCMGFLPNEEFGIHLGKPVILMFDEWGKANTSVKLATLRTMLEREIGNQRLHPDSIVFATTNLGAENVGDMLPAHARNRLTVVRMRKPTSTEWLQWGIGAGIHPVILSWVKDTPQLFQSFEDVPEPNDNPYIYHPQVQRAAFVTGRSLHAASDWLHLKDSFSDEANTSLLAGTIGARGALDLMAYVSMFDDLPRLQDIKDHPEMAKVPQSAAALCMVVYRTLSVIDATWLDAWMTYLNRLEPEAQGLFANGVRQDTYPHRAMVMGNKSFTNWAMANGHMFAADKA